MQKLFRNLNLSFLFLGFICVLSLSASAEELKEQERCALPPSDSAPEDWTRIPFYESRPEFVPTEAESQRGFALFTRPLVDSVYPESRPGAEERTEKLSFFAAGNQFQTLNFAVYPLKALPGLRVQAGAFQKVADLPASLKDAAGFKEAAVKSGGNASLISDGASAGRTGTEADTAKAETPAVFPMENVQVRLVTYRGIRYPGYSSKTKEYRILPEYLQDVTVTDAPALEPQRYFLTFRVPAGMTPGIYSGKIFIAWGENSAQRIADAKKSGAFSEKASDSAAGTVLPVELAILDFDLQRDPGKHYSAYFYPKKNEDGTLNRDVMEREFAVMRDYGFTRSPVYQMQYDHEGKCFKFPEYEYWIDLMERNGMEGPIPTIGGAVTWIASRYYDGKFGKHIRVEAPPKEEFYEELARMCRDLKKKYDARPEGAPEMVFGPLDEIAAESVEFGTRIYKIFHDAGLVTYTTKEPVDPTYEAYDDVVDIFASQMFGPEYDGVMESPKPEYWCYPNHNSYERKDMVIMCKGGRMTYGFGFWRSGFDLLIPWIWRASKPNHFDLSTSSGSNILHPETGEVIVTTYWECFREGINDLSYLYTLQNAVIQREGTQNAKLNEEIRLSRALLQEIWDSINVQEKYLNRNLWESGQFDLYRLRMAERIQALYQYEAVNEKTAPSVIIEPRKIEFEDPFQTYCKTQDAAGKLEKLPFDPKSAVRSELEAEVKLVSGADLPAGAKNAEIPLLTVTIDKQHDGSAGNGLYPSNWPALASYLSQEDYDKTNFGKPKGLLVRFYIDSNRTEKAEKTPIHVGIHPGGYRTNIGPEFQERTWHTVYVPLENAGYEGMPPVEGLPKSVRFTISEANHQDGDVLKIYFDEISFIK